jgi:hypothetical protein
MKAEFAQRSDLISRRQLMPREAFDKDKLKITPRLSLNLKGIDGCRTSINGYTYSNKPHCYLTNLDIEGSTPSQRYTQNIKPLTSLNSHDIEGKFQKFKNDNFIKGHFFIDRSFSEIEKICYLTISQPFRPCLQPTSASITSCNSSQIHKR